MPPPTAGRSSGPASSNGAAGGRASGARRERPVITVLEARPMNEVGFRGGSDAAAGRERPEITVVGARPMSQGPSHHIYEEIPETRNHPQARGRQRQPDILPPPYEEAPPTYHEAITETGADGGPPPLDLPPSRPESLPPPKSAPPPRPKSLPPPRPAPPAPGRASAPVTPVGGTSPGAADARSRQGSTSSLLPPGRTSAPTSPTVGTSDNVEDARARSPGLEPAPGRPPPPSRPRAPSSEPSEMPPETFVPIKGKKPMGIAVFPFPSKPSGPPVPTPREKPEPAPRKPGPPPIRASRLPISASHDSIHHTAEQADDAEKAQRVEQNTDLAPQKVLPSMPISASLDNIRNVGETQAAVPVKPTPRKRQTVNKPRPMSMPPAESEQPAGGSGGLEPAVSVPGAESDLNKRLSGSAFALHIEDDAHALVPRELRGSKPNLAPKPNKPPKPGVKPKPALLPSKPKPPAVMTKPKTTEPRTTWYAAESGENQPEETSSARTHWYTSSEESSDLIDLTTPKKPEPLPHGPTIIRRNSNKSVDVSEQASQQAGKPDKHADENVAAEETTPLDTAEKTAAPAPEVRKPTIIKPLKTKTIKSITEGSSLAMPDMAQFVESERPPGNVSVAQSSENPPSNSPDAIFEEPKQPVSGPTIIRPSGFASPPLEIDTTPSPAAESKSPPPTAPKPMSPTSRASRSPESRGSEGAVSVKRNSAMFETLMNNNKTSECVTCDSSGSAPTKPGPTDPAECIACQHDDDDFHDHTCEKAPKSPGLSPRLAPIGFEGLVPGHSPPGLPHRAPPKPERLGSPGAAAHQPLDIQPQESDVSDQPAASSRSLHPRENDPSASVPMSREKEQSSAHKLNTSAETAPDDSFLQQNEKVPPPLPSAPPVGSQWDLRQLQGASSDQLEPVAQQKAEASGAKPSEQMKKTPPARPPPARPAPPRPAAGPSRPATSPSPSPRVARSPSPSTQKLYPSLSVETDSAANSGSAAASPGAASPRTPPGRPAAKPGKFPAAKTGGAAPALPERPGPGHPLYHYVVSGPHAIALFDFTGDAADDLALKAGDVIELISWVDADWLRGKVGDKEGIFPSSFCDIVEPLPEPRPSQAPETVAPKMPSWDDVDDSIPSVASMSGPRCVARFDFEGEGQDDLSFKEGDVIRLKSRVGEWLRGELRGVCGLFPVAFVEILEDLPAEPPPVALSPVRGRAEQPPSPSQSAQLEEPHCIAVHSYSPDSAEDLAFSEGDRIVLTQRLGPDWLMGTFNGQSGMFPTNFVNIVKDLEDPGNKANIMATENAASPPAVQEAPPTPGEADTAAAPITPSAPTDDSSASAGATSGPTLSARAMFDFDGESEEDLSFKVGEKMELLERIGDGSWLRGRLSDGRTGMFPANYVSVTHPLPEML